MTPGKSEESLAGDFRRFGPEELDGLSAVVMDFKRHTGNSILRGKQDVRLSLHGSTRRVRRSKDKLRSFVLAPSLPSAPWQ